MSLTATLGLGGSVAYSADIILNNTTHTVGSRTILASNALTGAYYDTAGNPPQGAFDSVLGIRALEEAEINAGTPVITDDLKFPLDFDQGKGTDPPFFPHGTNDTLFSVWSGEIVVDAAAAGTYRFDSASDDGTVAFVDGVYVVRNNFYQGRTRRNFTFNLTEGAHPLVMAWYEGGSGANGTFWLYKDGTGEKIVNPAAGPAGITFRKVEYKASTTDAGMNVIVGPGNGTLDIVQETPITFGSLTLADGKTLTVSSLTDATFTGTKLGATGTMQVNSGRVITGPITGGPVTTFTKTGVGGTVVADDLASTAFTPTSVINVNGGQLIARAGILTGGTRDSSISDAKIVLNGGTFVGRGVTGEVAGKANEIGLTFWNGPSLTTHIQPIDSGDGLLVRPGGKPVAWGGALALDDDNPDFGHANFNTVSGGFVGVDNLQVLGYGRMTFTGPTEYSFGTWSDDGVNLWLDLDNDGKFEEDAGELIHNDNTFHAPKVAVTAGVTIPAGTYRFATGFYEGGGNAVMDFRIARGSADATTYDELKANFKQITASGNGIVTVSSILFGTSADFTPNAISVQSDSGLTGEDATLFGTVAFDQAATVNTNGGVTIQNVNLNAPGGFRTQSGTLVINNLNIDPGEAYNQAGGTATINNVNVSGAGTVNLNSSGTLRIDNLVAGANAVTIAKAGTGSLVPTRIGGPGLGATSKYDISAGSLVVTNDAAGATTLGANNVNLSGGTLQLNTVNTSPVVPGTPFLGEGYAATIDQTNGAPGDAIIIVGSGLDALNPPTTTGQSPRVRYTSVGDWPFDPDIPDVGQPDDFFARFTGTVPLPAGTTTFTTTSDDGSTLFVDINNDNDFDDPGEFVVDNRGLHGDQLRSGTATVPTAGNYRVRTQMYERGGGASLIATYGPSLGGQIFLGERSDFGPVDYKSNVTSTANSTINVGGAVGAFLGNVSAEGNTLTIRGNRLRVNDVSAGAGGVVAFTSAAGGQVTGSLSGAGTLRAAGGTVDLTRSGAAATGTPQIDIGRASGMRFAPGAANTYGGAAITKGTNEGLLHAANGIVDLSGATITTTNVPGLQAGLLGGRVAGGFNVTDFPASPTIDLRLSRAQSTDVAFFGGNGGTWVYSGEVRITDTDGDGIPGPFAFAEQFDDNVLLKIDGKEYINNTAWNIPHSSGPIELADTEPDGNGTPGDNWFTFEARFGDFGGGVGPNSGFDLGFGIDTNSADGFDAKTDPATNTPVATRAQYVEAKDPGDRTVFRAVNPAAGNVRVDAGTTLRVGALVGANDVTVAAGGKLEFNTETSKVYSLNLAGAPGARTSTADLTDADVVFQSTGPNKATDFKNLYADVKQAFTNGAWTGMGITSSTAAANAMQDTGVTVVDNALLGYTDFGGRAVDANSILLKYTYYGDIDQNGQVDADDLTVFANNFGRTAGATQVDGDIDFNGTVDADDLTIFANNFNKGVGAPLAVAAASVQAVPEPGSLVLAGLGAAGILAGVAARKRNNRKD